jgi:hypothetical protein
VNETWYAAYNENEQLEILNAMKMMAYLRNVKTDILEFLYNQMLITWQKESLEPKRLRFKNEIPRIINRLSLTYKPPANRIIDADSYDKSGDEVKPPITQENYNDTHPSIQMHMKDVSFVAKLMNTILVMPIYDQETETFRYVSYTRADCDVEYKSGNKNKLEKVRHFMDWRNPNNDNCEEIIIITWTDSEYYATTLDGKRLKPEQWREGDNLTDENPYGVIPFVILRMTETEGFWGDGLAQLVANQEEVNVRLTDLGFKTDMTFGVPVGTNLKIEADKFNYRPDKGIFVEDIRADTLNPNLDLVTPEHRITEQRDLIEAEQADLALSVGLPQDRVRYNSSAERELASLELLEINENDQEIYREFEKRLFEMDKIILKAYSNLNIGETFNIEYGKIEFPKTEEEQIKEREWNLKYNITNVVDIYKEETGIDSNEEAVRAIEANKAANQKYIGQGTDLGSLLVANEGVIEPIE